MQFNEKRMLDRLMEMIRIDSPSFHEKPMTDYLEKYFKDRGYEVYRDEAGSKFGSDGGNVLVHIPGTMEGEAICFNAHQDTVEPGRGIEPVYQDGKVRSAGDTVLGADDKSGIAMLMELLDVIKENHVPHREMYYLFTICEEQGMHGAKNFDISKLPCRNLYALDGAGQVGGVSTSSPSKYGIRALFHGKAAHAGIEPQNGINAVCMAARAISLVKFGRIDEETTSNVGRIEGGGMTNVVSDSAFFTAEVRSHSEEKLQHQLELIKKACQQAAEEFGGKAEVELSHDYPAAKPNPESFLYQLNLKALKAEGIEPHYVISGGGGDSNIFSGKGFECGGISTGMLDVHGVNETLHLDIFQQAFNVVYRMMTTPDASL